MNDVLRAQQRQALLTEYHHVRLCILEQTSLQKTVDEFCQRQFTGNQTEEAESWILHFEHLLAFGIDKDDKDRCLHVFFARRHEMLAKTAAVVEIIGKR
jgi:hypothetical protein